MSNILDLWWVFGISFLMFLWNGMVHLETKEVWLAFILLVVQFAFAFFGYGVSHYPYLLYPYLTIYDSFTNPAMAISLIVVFILGLGLLIPSLYLLLRLFLFDKDYVRGKKDQPRIKEANDE